MTLRKRFRSLESLLLSQPIDFRKLASHMKNEELKTICKKTFLKSLQRDLQITGIPVMVSGDEFVSESLGRSKQICHALLHELSESSEFFLFLEDEEIEAIVNDAYLEMDSSNLLL